MSKNERTVDPLPGRRHPQPEILREALSPSLPLLHFVRDASLVTIAIVCASCASTEKKGVVALLNSRIIVHLGTP